MNPRLFCDQKIPYPSTYFPLTCMGNMAHPEASGSHLSWSIPVNLTWQHILRMWAAIAHTKDIGFLWALWYRKGPRSLPYNGLRQIDGNLPGMKSDIIGLCRTLKLCHLSTIDLNLYFLWKWDHEILIIRDTYILF